MENVITEVSKYLIILLMMIYTFSCFTVFRKRDIEDQKNVLRRQIVLMLFMNLVAYTVLFLQNNDMKILMMYGAVFLFIVVVQILYRVIYVIPLQLMGYYVSVAKGLDVDKPRNLAKSGTTKRVGYIAGDFKVTIFEVRENMCVVDCCNL